MKTAYIESVRQYNQRMKAKYMDDISKWDARKGGFPYMGFYIYTKPETNDEYIRGVVVVWESKEGGKGSRLFQRKENARQYLQELTK